MPFAFEVSNEGDFSWLQGRVVVEGEVANSGGHMVVRGTVRARAVFECQRCLEAYETELVAPLEQEYRESTPEAPLPEDAAYGVFQGDELDLTDLVRDSLLLAEPMKKVCQLDCKGLCPVCGQNRNRRDCGCESGAIDPRLAALQQLLDPKK